MYLIIKRRFSYIVQIFYSKERCTRNDVFSSWEFLKREYATLKISEQPAIAHGVIAKP